MNNDSYFVKVMKAIPFDSPVSLLETMWTLEISPYWLKIVSKSDSFSVLGTKINILLYSISELLRIWPGLLNNNSE